MLSAAPSFCCPDEDQPISESVHLARLASFYPACRDCPHRGETGLLPKRTVAQLERIHGEPAMEVFGPEGLRGRFPGDLTVAHVANTARALGLWLFRDHPQPRPQVLLASDGRPCSGELVAAASQGLRWAGCDVLDAGSATSASLVRTANELDCTGSVLVAAREVRTQMSGLRLFAHGAPLSQGSALDAIYAMAATEASRPTRIAGSIRRVAVAASYRELLRSFFHALRPLRIVLRTPSVPLRRELDELSRQLACRILPVDQPLTPKLIREEHQAHFGLWIAGDGEGCCVFDEQGEPLSPLVLLQLLQAHLHTAEDRTLDLTSRMLSRAAVFEQIRERQAQLAADAEGRIWFGPQSAAADSLRLLACLLKILSSSDRPLSQVVRAAG